VKEKEAFLVAAKKRKQIQGVTTLPMSDVSFVCFVKEAVKNDLVGLTSHAKQRMRERKITLTQVRRVLKKGIIVEPVHQDQRGRWKATLQGGRAEIIRVVARLDEIDDGTSVIVVSTFEAG
jgi:uncharacterized protein YgiM (DUF1202 family)